MDRKIKRSKEKLSLQTVGPGGQSKGEWVFIPLCFAVVRLEVRKWGEGECP